MVTDELVGSLKQQIGLDDCTIEVNNQRRMRMDSQGEAQVEGFRVRDTWPVTEK
jgi:hypothetical protein